MFEFRFRLQFHFQVFIMETTKRYTHVINVDHNETIGSLLDKVSKTCKIPTNYFALYIGGKNAHKIKDKTLRECGLRHDSTFHLHLCLSGMSGIGGN